MARKMSQQDDSGSVEPMKESGKERPLVGRAKINLSPIKNWSGGMSESEVKVWEAIAEKCRSGVKPSIAAAALGMKAAYFDLRRRKHPAFEMLEEAKAEGIQVMLGQIRLSGSWQALMTLLERQYPMEFAVDSAIRGQLNELAQEAGFTNADLLDAVRMIQDAKDSGVDLAEVLRQAKVDLHGTEPVEGDQSPFQAP